MLDVVSAFGLWEQVEDVSAEFPEFVDRSLGSVSQQLFELAEGEFDRVEIRGVGRQIADFRSRRLDRFADPANLVAGEIVHHHNVPGLQRWNQVLLDPTQKDATVDRAFHAERSNEAGGSHRSQEGRG